MKPLTEEGAEMKITHSMSCSFIQGKPADKNRIDAWLKAMKVIDHRFMIMADDSDDDEISFTVIISGTTQKERSEYAAVAKRSIK
jgi:hypothetical protein